MAGHWRSLPARHAVPVAMCLPFRGGGASPFLCGSAVCSSRALCRDARPRIWPCAPTWACLRWHFEGVAQATPSGAHSWKAFPSTEEAGKLPGLVLACPPPPQPPCFISCSVTVVRVTPSLSRVARWCPGRSVWAPLLGGLI